MITRCAFFEGRILGGHEEEFDDFVRSNLVPLWTRFPGALNVTVLREVEAEGGSHRYPLILQISYPNLAAVEAALQSAVRFESREETKKLLEMFEGRVFHVVYDSVHYHAVTA